jgi:hypothetical protein
MGDSVSFPSIFLSSTFIAMRFLFLAAVLAIFARQASATVLVQTDGTATYPVRHDYDGSRKDCCGPPARKQCKPGQPRCCELGLNLLLNPGFEDSSMSPTPWVTDRGRVYSRRTKANVDPAAGELPTPYTGMRAIKLPVTTNGASDQVGAQLTQNYTARLCPTRHRHAKIHEPTDLAARGGELDGADNTVVVVRTGSFVWFPIGKRDLASPGEDDPTTNPNRGDCRLTFTPDGAITDTTDITESTYDVFRVSGTDGPNGGLNGWLRVEFALASAHVRNDKLPAGRGGGGIGAGSDNNGNEGIGEGSGGNLNASFNRPVRGKIVFVASSNEGNCEAVLIDDVVVRQG